MDAEVLYPFFVVHSYIHTRHTRNKKKAYHDDDVLVYMSSDKIDRNSNSCSAVTPL